MSTTPATPSTGSLSGRLALVTGPASGIDRSNTERFEPSAGMSAYCAAKAGVVMLTEVAPMELGARGIRVNSIAPGLVETNATSTVFMMPGVVEEFVENTTLGQFAQPDDIAAMAAFLASDESSFVSGAMFRVDGGASMKRYPDLPAAFARLTLPAE